MAEENAQDNRRRELSEAQSKEYVRQRMAGAGISAPPAYAKKENAQGTGYVDEYGEIPGEDRMRETLARNQASSSLAQSAGGGGRVDAGSEIQKQTNSLNHYTIVEFLPELVALDISCFGLLLPITLPIYDGIFIGYLGHQLYNGFTGNKSIIPFFPELTWESLAPPGTNKMSVPLPLMPLYVLTFACIIGLALFNVVVYGIFGMLVYVMVDPVTAIGAFKELFPFLMSVAAS